MAFFAVINPAIRLFFIVGVPLDCAVRSELFRASWAAFATMQSHLQAQIPQTPRTVFIGDPADPSQTAKVAMRALHAAES